MADMGGLKPSHFRWRTEGAVAVDPGLEAGDRRVHRTVTARRFRRPGARRRGGVLDHRSLPEQASPDAFNALYL